MRKRDVLGKLFGSTLRLPSFGMLSRYDVLLLIVPASFMGALLASKTLSLPPQKALFASSIVGALALADGLFLNPPTTGLRR